MVTDYYNPVLIHLLKHCKALVPHKDRGGRAIARCIAQDGLAGLHPEGATATFSVLLDPATLLTPTSRGVEHPPRGYVDP